MSLSGGEERPIIPRVHSATAYQSAIKHTICTELMALAHLNNVPRPECLHVRNTIGMCRPVKVSNKPLAYVWKNFISREEAKHIATLAAPFLRQSLVGDNQKSSSVRSYQLSPAWRL